MVKRINQLYEATDLLSGDQITFTTGSNNGFIFPYIVVQSGTMDNVEIGQDFPNVGSFTDLTVSQLLHLGNIIQLGDESNPVHGLAWGSEFFGVINQQFTYDGPALFESLFLQNGSNLTEIGPDLYINAGPGGNVILPSDIVAYQPSTENRTTSGVAITLGPENISFVTNTSPTIAPLTLPTVTQDGYLKQVVSVQGSLRILADNVVDAGTGTTNAGGVIDISAGQITKLIWSQEQARWFIDHGSGCVYVP